MEHVMKYASPLGELTAVARDGRVTALVLPGQRYAQGLIPNGASACAPGAQIEALAALRAWLDAYFAGRRPDPGTLPLAPQGTAFRQSVWRALLAIPYGETATYGEIARIAGGSARAVGGAVGHNPISIVIPCHRVIGADGRLTGYAGGIENKRRLLAWEGARCDEQGR